MVDIIPELAKATLVIFGVNEMPCLKPRLDLKNHLHGLLQIFDVDLAPSAS